MAIEITRRDLLNGMAIGAVGAMLPAYAGAPKVMAGFDQCARRSIYLLSSHT